MQKKQIIGLGGTFDHFHDGHQHFLQFANQLADKLIIGITHPKLTKHKQLANLIEPFPKRKKAVIKYCRDHNIRIEVVQLTNIYGPTLEKSNVRGLCVTEETIAGAKQINDLRLKMNLHELEVFVCPFHKDEAGKMLDSSGIRAGQVNRRGQVYSGILERSIRLNEKQRQYFAKPQGKIINTPQEKPNSFIAVVGDTSLEKFINNKWAYNLGIYDKKVQRQQYHSFVIEQLKGFLRCVNDAGNISPGMTSILTKTFDQEKAHIYVTGEEDLAAVALMLMLPLGSVIYYGQPNDGLVEMEVTEKRKEAFHKILTEQS